jgi:hypothetical protein
MKKLLFLLLLIFGLKSYAYIPSQSEIRILYQQATIKEGACQKLIFILQSYNENSNPLFAGYRASATMMMANYVFNPFRKMSYFSKGKHMLEKSIENQNDNIELRFLRFAVQTSIPFFLGYGSSIEQDKFFLIKGVSKIKDLELKQLIISFLQKSKYLTGIEKQNLQV